MALIRGSRLGTYEILAAIGAGGMGQVYRAVDSNLKRAVAIKVLPASVASDADRLARFQREAEVLAALNHPNIGAIYGLEKTPDCTALVMELVEGDDLSQHIANGAIPIDEALPIAKQIADALEAAHEQGIIHRDLKPANIKVRSDGTVKVLDFGLAKALTGDAASARTGGHTASPTITSPAMTDAGMILGTAAYMAPEQAKGRAVDKRADIWAFGVVLYEMLTGSHPFLADTIPETLAQVMTRPIDFGTLPATTPRRIRDLLARCLVKDSKKRLRDIGEARIRLEDVLSGVAEEPSSPAGAIAARQRSVVPWLATAAVTLALAVLAFVHFREAPVAAPAIASYLNAPEGVAYDFGLAFTVASGGATPELSPDGKWIVFGARTSDNKVSLWKQLLSSNTAQMLAGTEGATFPFWSPDSRSVAFFSGGKLKKVDITGGPAIPIADAANGRGGSWSAEGVIVFSPDLSSGPLLRITESGGTPSPATSVQGSRVHRFPWFLPDGRHFVFQEQITRGSINVVLRIGSLDSPQTVEIGPASSNAVYSSGHLLFLREATLMAQPFDPDKRSVQGEAVPVVTEQVSWVLNDGRKGVFTVSRSGMLVYQALGDAGNQRLSWFDRAGKLVSAVVESGNMGSLELSPKGERAAVAHVDATGNTDTLIHDLRQNRVTRFTFDPAQDRRAIWSPDGNSLVWVSIGEKRTLRRKFVDGDDTEEVLYEDARLVDVTSWSPDGKFLLVDIASSGMGIGIWSLPITPEKSGSLIKPTEAFRETPFSESQGVFSPDGDWVAYRSDESGHPEINVIPFPGPGGKRTTISTTGGVRPRWRGNEIFYVGPDGKLMAAEVTPTASGIDVGQVKPLGITVPTVGLSYDVSLDGQRILAITELERKRSSPLTLVQNWTSRLNK